jgi:hypothetical protein
MKEYESRSPEEYGLAWKRYREVEKPKTAFENRARSHSRRPGENSPALGG